MRNLVTVRASVVLDFIDNEEISRKEFYESADITDKTFAKVVRGENISEASALKIANRMDVVLEAIVVGGARTTHSEASRHSATGSRPPWRGLAWHDPSDYGHPPNTFPFDTPNRRFVFHEAIYTGGAIWYEQNLETVDEKTGQEIWITKAHTWVQVPLKIHLGAIEDQGSIFRRLDMYEEHEGGIKLDKILEFFVCDEVAAYISNDTSKRLRPTRNQDHIFMRWVPIRDDIPFDYAAALHLHGPFFRKTALKMTQLWVEGESYTEARSIRPPGRHGETDQ